MLYLVKSHLFGNRKYIYKVGYSDESNLNNRLGNYFYCNPGIEVISVRQGDEMMEKMIHLYLYSLGYQYKKDGKLNEWFIESEDIRQIFHITVNDLGKKVWRDRDNIFDASMFPRISNDNRISLVYKIYVYLHDKFSSSSKLSRIDKEYKDYLVKKSIKRYTGYGEVCTKEDEIARNFLDNKFYSLKVFKDRMKIYCEFMDNPDISDKIKSLVTGKILDPSYYKYYTFYGTKGCSARKFIRGILEEGIQDASKDHLVLKEVSKVFLMDHYTNKEVKQLLQGIYNILGINRKAKATDIKNYAEITRSKIKGVEGIKIISIKRTQE